MNEVFLIGKIISNIEFKFKLNKNNQVFINGYIENNVVKAKCINIY